MKIQNYLYSGALAACLCACASPAETQNMICSPTLKAKTSSPYYKAISLEDVKGGKSTNPMWTSQVSNEDFKNALIASLKNAEYLSETKGKYTLHAELKEMKQPLFGFDTTVESVVNYLIEDEKGKNILEKEIKEESTSTVSDKFIGTQRLQHANEGAVRKNIESFIKVLG